MNRAGSQSLDPRRRRRVQPIEPSALHGEQRTVFDRIAESRGDVTGPFTILLHVPELAERVQRLGAYLRYEASLDRDVAELGVLVTALACGSSFEWSVHEPLARAAGVPDDVIRSVRDDADSTRMPPRHRTVVDYARELARSGEASDATYHAALQLLGVEGVVELTVLVGYYAMLAMTLNAHQVPACLDGPPSEVMSSRD